MTREVEAYSPTGRAGLPQCACAANHNPPHTTRSTLAFKNGYFLLLGFHFGLADQTSRVRGNCQPYFSALELFSTQEVLVESIWCQFFFAFNFHTLASCSSYC